MTDEPIAALGPAFGAELRRHRDCFGQDQDRVARHFDNDCRGLLSDLPRMRVEPIALASVTAVRTLHEFLVTARRCPRRAASRNGTESLGLVAVRSASELGEFARGANDDDSMPLGITRRTNVCRVAGVPS